MQNSPSYPTVTRVLEEGSDDSVTDTPSNEIMESRNFAIMPAQELKVTVENTQEDPNDEAMNAKIERAKLAAYNMDMAQRKAMY